MDSVSYLFRYTEDQIKLGKLISNLVEKKYNYKHISNYLNLYGYRTSKRQWFTLIIVSMFLNQYSSDIILIYIIKAKC